MASDPEHTRVMRLTDARTRAHAMRAIGLVADDPRGFLEVVLGAADSAAALVAVQQRYGVDELQSVAMVDVQLRRMSVQAREQIVQWVRDADALVAELEVATD
ncbi:hypothetical protein [Nocardioides sp.]|uniref:hypothetical protein n=1 Tax=Nocardioides sp. TaxID=35761 RepID=UPI0027286995|nr:hypothetical protein [Nocardioides sp.]MDO9456026.1 hypothetical protein [Nocardioides sp.]